MFGRERFGDYIRRELANGNLVRIKNKSIKVSERAAPIADGYNLDAFDNVLSQNESVVNTYSMQNGKKNSLSMADIAPVAEKYGDLHISGKEKRLDSLREEHGIYEPGEKPAREVKVPKKTEPDKKVSQTVRTILEAEATPDELLPTIEELTREVRAHNNFSQRMPVVEEQIKVINHRLNDLEEFHKPN